MDLPAAEVDIPPSGVDLLVAGVESAPAEIGGE